jgi:ATP-dependent RNA helicase RhlE
MPEQIASLASSFLLDPVRIAITPVSQPLNKIVHQTIKIEKNQKLSLLIHLLKNPELKSVLIFMRTKRGAKRTALNLTHQGHTVVELHGNQSQAQRQFAMKKFKEKHVRILVATDLASRGIDIHQLSHVINFDMPETAEAFLHRTGRTGRAGFSGDVFNFVSREESSLLHMINRHTGMSLTPSIMKDFVFDSSLVVHGGGDDEGDRPRYQSRERSGQRSYGGSSRSSSGRGYGSSQTPRSFGNPPSTESGEPKPYTPKPYQGDRAPRRYDSRSSSSGPRSSGYQGRNPRPEGQSSGYQGRTPREPGQSSGYQGRTPRDPGQSSGYEGRTPREPGQSSSYEGKRPSYQSRNNTFKKRNP